ncbi:MAG TPA: cupin domain-containing protein [Candidatus Limnocylindrales bacterium]|nr:cupin domain-containing protein [Candidatus Limnocylindrales bacterium]
MTCSRRDLTLLLPLLAARASAQPAAKLPTRVYRFEDLPVKTNGQNQSRAILNGQTHEGMALEVHMTDLAAGASPHPPHKHVHEEMVMLIEGQLDATIGGETTRLSPGSVIFFASGDEHGTRNPGPGRARYFVVALGRDA